ncbi:MAG: hypothetical protein OEQ18_00865 [Gammaproteobacteria bacterium]|nr:hypothetical protein [Gammaproteobacteria bacterium]
MTTTTNLPEDSVLRRHAVQLQQAGAASSGTSRTQTPPASTGHTQSREPKGFLGRLMDKLFGG